MRAAVDVVDHLGVDVLVGTEHREARSLGRAHDLLAHAPVAALPVLELAEGMLDRLVYFADLPALRSTRSSA